LASRAGYSILVPDGWQFRDRTGLSDHLTHVYRDPVNHRRRLVVTVSTCVGCVMKNVASMDFRPDPAKVLPPGVRSQTLLTKWKLAYRAFWGGNPYPDNGLVVIHHRRSHIQGYVRTDLWLPASQRSLATRMLDSLRVPAEHPLPGRTLPEAARPSRAA
jgi:hypothetical protein